jgi:hypothetical protein
VKLEKSSRYPKDKKRTVFLVALFRVGYCRMFLLFNSKCHKKIPSPVKERGF